MELNNVAGSKSSVYLALSFRKLCLATVGLPLVSLLFCFITAYTFQQDDIHETHCRVSLNLNVAYVYVNCEKNNVCSGEKFTTALILSR